MMINDEIHLTDAQPKRKHHSSGWNEVIIEKSAFMLEDELM